MGLLDAILPAWRASLPEADHAYLDGFVQRYRATLEAMLDTWSARREDTLADRRVRVAADTIADLRKVDVERVLSETPAAERVRVSRSLRRRRPDLADELDLLEATDSAVPRTPVTVKSRTEANIQAMRVAATSRPDEMSAQDRRALLQYTGWGGLSIEGLTFPPGLAPDDFALIHEYYTPQSVADAISDVVCPLLPGLAGRDGVVRAFEPSVGIGRLLNALGPPRCLVDTPPYVSTKWTAVELSGVSAKMFAAIRPDVDLYVGSLESWMQQRGQQAQGTFSLVVSNPPYGDRGEYARQDTLKEYDENAAYAYFLRRGLDLLVPGGLGVYIIPSGFMTGTGKPARKLREKVLLRHHIEVAFRLPAYGTDKKPLFPGAGNVLDVIFFRSRGGELATVDPADMYILDGLYYAETPTHVLGTEREPEKGASKGKWDRYLVIGDFRGFPAFRPREVCVSCQIHKVAPVEAPEFTPVARETSSEGAPPDLARALALGARVDAYFTLVANDDEKALALWPELRDALMAFRSFGPVADAGGNPWAWPELRTQSARRALAGALLRAYQRNGDLSPAVDLKPNVRPKFTAPPDDVLAQAEYLFRLRRQLSVPELVRFHRAQMGTLSQGDVIERLTAAGWCLDGEQWNELLPRKRYLSGMLWPKYDRATERANAGDAQARAQARMLEERLNLAVYEDLKNVSPRQGWVPLSLVSDWVGEALNGRYGDIEFRRDAGVISPRLEKRDGSELSYNDLGELTPISLETLWFIGWLNHDNLLFKPKLDDSRINDLRTEEEEATGKPVVLGVEDADADEKTDEADEDKSLGLIRLLLGRHWDRAFAAWVRADSSRRTQVTDAYNRSFRGVVVPTYDNERLSIARWTQTGPQLKPHQVAGALRVLDQNGGLIAFDVGVGKTYTAIAIVGAAREAGTVRRPVVLVPSSLVWKWHDDFLCVMADYRVLVIGSNRKYISRGDRKGVLTSVTDTPAERAQKWTEFQAGLWDVVVLSYDALGRTSMNEEALVSYLDTIEAIQREVKLRQRNAAGKKADKLTERDRAIMKHGVRAFIEENLALPANHKYDPGIAWDDIGIDLLIVDEAASFKNSYKPQPREFGMPKFMGSTGDGSKRAWQLDFRAAAVRAKNGGSGIVLLTATPAKNSPLEFYNLIQLIEPRAFSTKGLMDPEQFIDRFVDMGAREVYDMLLNIKVQSVVEGFRNLDDLKLILETFGEFRTAVQVGIQLPEPRIELIRVPMSEEQQALYKGVRFDLERLLSRGPQAGQSSSNAVLGLMARLSVIAMHPALDGGDRTYENALDIGAANYAAPKLDACAERVVASAGCGHIIFADSTAVHAWMREVLVARGIPRERIAILNATTSTSADRLRVSRDFNGLVSDPPAPGSCAGPSSRRVPPKYDVVIANIVAYEGVDLQVRTCAIHHLDLPWTPADLEQRNGRAVRQGNELATVFIYYYLSDRSLDWYRFQLIQGKRGWLSTILEGAARETSNPGAQQELSNEDMLMMISDDPEKTARLFAEKRARDREAARERQRATAAAIATQAAARFRDARQTLDPERASRLRSDGEARLVELSRADASAWPWGQLMSAARDTNVLVASANDPPVFEGLRYARGEGPTRSWGEFGRVYGTKIGHRKAFAPAWEMLDEAQVTLLRLQPSEVGDAASDWPDEELAAPLAEHVAGADGADLYELGWLGASDAWLTRWWPSVAKAITRKLQLQGSVASTRIMYPSVLGGKLTLTNGPEITGQLVPFTQSGWEQYLRLANSSEYKWTELNGVASAWWHRQFPKRRGDAAGDEPLADSQGAAPAVETATQPAPGPSLELTEDQLEQMQSVFDRGRVVDGTPEEVDRRVIDNLALTYAASNDALAIAGAGKANRSRLAEEARSTAERITILRAIAELLRTKGYDVALAGQAQNSFNIVGRGQRVMAAANYGKMARYAPGLTDEERRQLERDLAESRQRATEIILEETATRGPAVSEDMMLAVWFRARAPTPKGAGGRFWKVGERYYADTPMIPGKSSHVGYGDFSFRFPNGSELYFARQSEDKTLPEQTGRLHLVTFSGRLDGGGADLGTTLRSLGGALGGTFERWPGPDAPALPASTHSTAPAGALAPEAAEMIITITRADGLRGDGSPKNPLQLLPALDVNQRVSSFEEASQVYRRAAYDSGEGASSFPEGYVLLPDGRKFKVSFNGRIWDGDEKVYDPTSSPRKTSQAPTAPAALGVDPGTTRATDRGLEGRYEEARSAMRAVGLPAKKYAYYMRRAEDAIASGKAWAPVVARARRAAEKLAGAVRAKKAPAAASTEARRTARPPARGTTVESFNNRPSWRAEMVRPRANGFVLAIFPEGKDTDAAVASVDVVHGDIDEIRWLDDRLPQNDRDVIAERLEDALWDAYEDDSEDDEGEPRPSPVQDLIDLMERRSSALGARPAQNKLQIDRLASHFREDGYGQIAEALRDLAKPTGPSADELQQWLEAEALMTAGEIVGRARAGDPVVVRQLMRDVWDGVFEVLTLEEVSGRAGALGVPDQALFGGATLPFILQRVWEGERYLMRRVRVVVGEHDDETDVTAIEDPTDRLTSGAMVHRAERTEAFFIDLYGKLGGFQDDLERAPKTLQDVRTLLYWAAVMLDAPKCQGDVKARAAVAFTQAKAYHDTARRQLLEGRTVDAVRRLQEAMRRISTAAAEIARSCAEGQIEILVTPPHLPVSPEDKAAVNGGEVEARP